MTDNAPRTKRSARERGRDLTNMAAIDFAVEIANSDMHHRLAADFDTWRPGDLGRAPDFPQAVHDLFGMMSYLLGADRLAEAFLKSPRNWEHLRPIYAARYPEYKGLLPGRVGPSRSQFFRRYRSAAGDPLRLKLVSAAFTREATALARRMGMLDPALSSLSDPNPLNWVSGDGTVLPSRFRNGPGVMQVDRETGELSEVRHDIDAGLQVTGDGRNVTGTKFSLVHIRTLFPREWVVLSIEHVSHGKGGSEAGVALRQIQMLLGLAPGIDGVIWDMAMRGVHLDMLYALGLLSLVKVALAPGGAPKELLLGPATTAGGHTVTIRAIDGAAHIEAIVGTKIELIRLAQPKLLQRKNKDGTYRCYGEYRIPDDPRAPTRLRGDTVRVRLDTTADDKQRKINRAEGLRPIAKGDDRWATLQSGRPVAESLNAWFKHLWRNERAPAVTKGRQHLRMIYGGMVANMIAAITYRDRMNKASGAPPTQLAA